MANQNLATYSENGYKAAKDFKKEIIALEWKALFNKLIYQ